MKFKKLRAEGFGCLKDWESPELQKNIVIICGRNESGKSTLFKMVETLLYGWSPATADKNPYVPWDESHAQCSGHIIVGDEGQYIGRKLMSRPTGFLKIGDNQEDIANRSLPIVDHLSKEVYREVYALTSDELNLPSQTLWEKLKDQLLAGHYYTFIRPASKVMEELEGEANSLWRPDRRGKPDAKQLKEELSSLREELIDAEENDRRLYELEDSLEKSRQRLEFLTREKVELTAYIDWCESILPLQTKEKQIEKLLESAGEGAPFDHIPLDIEGRFSNIEDRIEDLREEIQDREVELRELKGISVSLTEVDTELLRNEESIEELVRSYDRIAGNMEKKLGLERDIDRVETILKRDGDELIIGGWKDVYIEPLKNIDEAQLRQNVAQYSDIKTKLEHKRAELSSVDVEDFVRLDTAKLMPGGILFSIIGIVGLFLPNSLFKFGGILFLAIGAVSLLFGWSARDGERQRKRLVKRHTEELERLDEELKRVQAEIHSCLQGIPFASIDEAYMGDNIIIDVDRLRRHIEELSTIDREYIYIKKEIETKADMVDRLMEDCRLDLGRDILADIDKLNTALNTAKDKSYMAEQAEQKAEDCIAIISEIQRELENLDSEKEDIVLKLEKFGGQDLEEKMQDLRRRRELYSKAQLIAEQLEIEKRSLPKNCFDSLDQWYIKNSESDKKVLNFDELAYAKVRIEELDNELNKLNANIGALEKELEHGQGMKTVHQIMGEMEAINRDLQDAAQKRDKLMLLKNIIDRADRQFKEEHQPDVLNRASEYLNIITEGKYSRIFIPDDIDEKVAILQRDNPYPVEVGETISRGTQEQIYLALRLALMDHLDGEYPMPAFLDEVFINWDGMRIQNGLELVGKIGAQRQIFIFTCHRWLVDLLSHNLDVQIVLMDESDQI